MDTAGFRDPVRGPIPGFPQTIPVQIHLYWAGADRDGQVVGFYWAVTETIPVALPGLPLPPVPGPKAKDYKYTVLTDSTFIFRVSEERPDRFHTFYIYAVDNLGKADPTPARFFFNAQDNFPPRAVIDTLRATGVVYVLQPNGSVIPETRTYFVHDSLNPATLPSDTVASGSLINVRWHGEPALPQAPVTGFRYKLDESTFNPADSSVHTATYNTGIGRDKVPPGVKVFTLRALDAAGWRGESTRRFQMNFSPDTWFSGPDTQDPLAAYATAGRDTFKDVPNWPSFTGLHGSLLSDDSVQVMPAARPRRRTFFELYQGRLFVHQEGDTVRMNSWVIVSSGGKDLDSPYAVRVAGNDPGTPVGPVTTPGPPNGSPIGFKSRITTYLDPGGPETPTAQTPTYPVFDAASSFRAPYINSYWPMNLSGRAYMITRAVDGDGEEFGGVDNRIVDARRLADLVDGGCSNCDYERTLRDKIIVFYVNKPPTLTTTSGSFAPRENQNLASRTVNFNLLADDLDPLDPANPPQRPGGPSTTKVLRRKVTFLGRNAAGRDTSFTDPNSLPDPAGSGYFSANFQIDIPTFIAGGAGNPVTIRVELCDCPKCGVNPGQGRCITRDIHVTIPAAPAPGATSSTTTSPGPGPSSAVMRSETP